MHTNLHTVALTQALKHGLVDANNIGLKDENDQLLPGFRVPVPSFLTSFPLVSRFGEGLGLTLSTGWLSAWNLEPKPPQNKLSSFLLRGSAVAPTCAKEPVPGSSAKQPATHKAPTQAHVPGSLLLLMAAPTRSTRNTRKLYAES